MAAGWGLVGRKDFGTTLTVSAGKKSSSFFEEILDSFNLQSEPPDEMGFFLCVLSIVLSLRSPDQYCNFLTAALKGIFYPFFSSFPQYLSAVSVAKTERHAPHDLSFDLTINPISIAM